MSLTTVKSTWETHGENIKKYGGLGLIVWIFIWTLYGISRFYYYFDITSIIFNTLFLASIYLCISLGLNMTYKLLGFANFAHAEYFIVGAYTGVWWTYFVKGEELSGISDYYVVILIAFVLSGLVAILGDKIVFKPLRTRNATVESLMIASIGWGILLRNLISIFFGGRSEYFRIDNTTHKIPTIKFGWRQSDRFLGIEIDDFVLKLSFILAILTTFIFVTGLIIFLEFTKAGKGLRATSDNRDLAESSGINTERMILITWFIGGGLAGVAGVIFTANLFVIPFSGFAYLLPAFAVVVLGGVGSIRGSIIAAFIIAFAEIVSKNYLSGQEKINNAFFNFTYERTGLDAYSLVFPFIILIGVILFRPSGIAGEDES